MASSRIPSEGGWVLKKTMKSSTKNADWMEMEPKNKRPMILFKSDLGKDNNPAKRGKMLPH
jgi:hypothetical protein